MAVVLTPLSTVTATLTNPTAQQQLQSIFQTERALLLLLCRVYGVDYAQALNAGIAWTTQQ